MTNASSSGAGPRRAALKLLRHTLDEARPLDDGLEAALKGLEGSDRAFARAIASTALRNKGVIDHVTGQFLNSPLRRKASGARHALLIGAAELLFLDTPPHAAVSEAVSLVHSDKMSAALSGVVNAVLRKVDTEGRAMLEGLDAAKLNTPRWLWSRWEGQYGEARTRAIAEAHSLGAPIDLTVAGDPALWAGRLDGEVLPIGSVRVSRTGDVTAWPGFRDGAWFVQDMAASLPVRLMGDLAGKTVIDLCAAPGGKTAQLAAAGADVTAVDMNEERLERVGENLARLNLDAALVAADARHFEAEPADAVLLDAPCSATGTIRRHPDLPWVKRPDDIKTLAMLQAQCLENAARLVKKGGTLIYCTCSLERGEGEHQMTAFLKAQPDFAIDPVQKSELPGLRSALTKEGFVRTLPSLLPDKGGMDGFFIARLVKSR